MAKLDMHYYCSHEDYAPYCFRMITSGSDCCVGLVLTAF